MTPFALPFMRTALYCGLLAGTALALLGVFMTARRSAFAGLAVSQLAALGAVAGIYWGLEHGLIGLSFGLACAGMLALPRLGRARRVSAEAWVGCLYVLGAGLAVVLLSKTPHGEAHTLRVFFGNILALDAAEVWESLALLAAVVAALGLWLPRWIWIFFDPGSAEVAGLSVARWNLFFYFLFAAVMAAGIHILGVLLAFAYLLLPASLGFLTSRRLANVFAVSVGVAAASTTVGLYLSFSLDVPAGPFIAALLALGALTAGLLRAAGVLK
jgi:ABC-type Mn2+/Zn2+ transport system permease subunit